MWIGFKSTFIVNGNSPSFDRKAPLTGILLWGVRRDCYLGFKKEFPSRRKTGGDIKEVPERGRDPIILRRHRRRSADDLTHLCQRAETRREFHEILQCQRCVCVWCVWWEEDDNEIPTAGRLALLKQKRLIGGSMYRKKDPGRWKDDGEHGGAMRQRRSGSGTSAGRREDTAEAFPACLRFGTEARGSGEGRLS